MDNIPNIILLETQKLNDLLSQDNKPDLNIKDVAKFLNIDVEVLIGKDLRDLLKINQKSSGYIFPDSNGNPYRPSNWSKRNYKSFMDSLLKTYPDYPALTPHEFRHTCGTLLYQSTGNIYAVSKFLGHADINITTKIYVHNDIGTLKKDLLFDN